MIHHVSVGVNDVEKAAEFYDPVLAVLGYKRVAEYLPHAIGYGQSHPEFWIQLPHDGNAATVGNGTHIGFAARSKKDVHKFHETAIANGGKNNGDPGPRPDYGPEYYGTFVFDRDGNKIEATLQSQPLNKAPNRTAKKKASPAIRGPAKKSKRPAKVKRKKARRK